MFIFICFSEQTLVEIKPKNGGMPYWKDLSKFLQGDDPALWWESNIDVNICSQPLPEAAVTCKRKRRRWYYSPMTGQCVRFMGCETDGNNFGRKYYCKSKCRTKTLSESQRKALENSPEVCNDRLPETAVKCTMKKRRWFYNVRNGKCEKFMGCESGGNNFSRKLYCKTKCRRRRMQFKLRSKAGNFTIMLTSPYSEHNPPPPLPPPTHTHTNPALHWEFRGLHGVHNILLVLFCFFLNKT